MVTQIPDLRACKKLGFIVPSSNTVVEPTCQAIIQDLNNSIVQSEDDDKDEDAHEGISTGPPNLICLFTRIRVKTVGTDSASTSQFDTETLVNAAQLLADAECDAILWNGTSGMWTGADLAADEALTQAMTEATSVPCSTTTLATVHYLREKGHRRISLATPYDEPLTQKCIEFFTSAGFEVVRAEHLDPVPESNLAIGKSSINDIQDVIIRAQGDLREDDLPDAVVVACTNWPGAGLAHELAEELDVQANVVDSVTVTVWKALRIIQYEGGVQGWVV